MSEHDANARPSQVTVAGWTVAIASTVVVLAVFQAMTDLHSLDTREEFRRLITRGSAKGLGLTVGDVTTMVRWCLYVAGVCAAASAILGVFVLQRHREARIVLTIVAVPIVLTAPFAGSLPGFVVGAGAALLWSRPARDWFAGRPVGPPAQRTVTPTVTPTTTPPSLNFPPPMPREPQAGPSFPPPTQPPVFAAPVPPAPSAVPVSAPIRVRIACAITWAFTSVTAIAALAAIGWVAGHTDDLIARVKRNPAWDPSMDQGLIVPATITLAVVIVLWCAAAAVLAYFAWRRQTWAWTLLIVSAAMAALLCVPAFPVSLAHLAASALCLGLLLNRESRSWYAGSAPRPGPIQPPRPW